MTNVLLNSIFIGVCNFLFVFMAIPFLRSYLIRSKRVETPNHRSSHSIPVPGLGGVMFVPFVLFLLIFSANWEMSLNVYLPLLLLGMLGLFDDLRDMKARYKFLIQIGIAALLWFGGFSIIGFFEIFGIQLDFWLFDFLVTLMFIVGSVNAFNLIDGIDGLASGILIINATVFAVIFYLMNEMVFFYLSIGIGAGTCAFLIYNFQPAKIFMGDTGSLLLGGFVTIAFLKILETNSPQFIAIALTVLLFPMLDLIRLFIGRSIIWKEPFKADKNHYHHLLLKLKWNHRRTTLLIYGLHAAIVIVTVVLSNFLPCITCIFISVALCILFYALVQFLYAYRNKRNIHELKNAIKDQTEDNYLLNKHL
ncbi:MAG: undecaprenyl/decaprenyl-phosphate alpha-N-acetylglucosaminyl 1-phosphate transferase [Crocinitomicaceae bacterium]|nr:undecaprenyl/decaprenyl-phosphate alpha-N-acetylglucosaminyl 1-phosphate transferase [Flavobacteriales bacterium]NQZ37992.1 undecaprenyl/decaprenyl-phosphate alpha-N-acetylglucosaminyl 1-phosphate transferase [Crocinitomicaceae bacterium]